VRQHFVAAIRDRAHGLRRTLGDDRVDHDAGFGAMVCEPIHQTMDANLDPVSRPGDRHGVECAGRKRIAHWTDAGRFAVRPGFEADVENHGDAFAARPSAILRFPVGLFHPRSGTVPLYVFVSA
jgi:hypothetical protein